MRFVVVVLIFLTAMPPIGGFLTFVLAATGQIIEGVESNYFWLVLFVGWIPYVMFSYILGGVQSLLVGIASAMSMKLTGRIPVYVPIIAATITGLPLIGGAIYSEFGLPHAVLLLVIHVVPAACVWKYIKFIERRPQVKQIGGVSNP